MRSPFGICIYSYMASRKFQDTLDFLDHCHDLGAAGIQIELTSLDAAFAEQVRAKAGEYGMYYEGIVSLPKDGDAAEFELQLIAAKAAGATVVRSACLSGRRYENFNDMASWKQFVRDSHESLRVAIPVLEKQKIKLALENHKDWTVDEMIDLFQQHQSEYLGCCLDFGNNISLLDPPDAVLKLVPYAVSTHVKDIGVESDPRGFRMAEVPMGAGVVDTPGLVKAIRAAKPAVQFSYEMINRDPLLIPCLTDQYWATFELADCLKLAKALTLVEERHSVVPLPRLSELSPAEGNLRQCLSYAVSDLL